MGYEAMREQTLARQKEMGLVPADTELPPINPIGTPETRTGPDGMPFPALDYTRPGTLSTTTRSACSPGWPRSTRDSWLMPTTTSAGCSDYLEATEQLDNTMVVVVSDNGASGEGGPNGSVNEMKFANGIADDLAENLAKLDDLGGLKTYNHYPTAGRWRSTPRSRCGSATSSTAGPATRASSPGRAGTTARGEIRDQYHHAIDIVPTILDFLGVDAPETIKGHVQSPIDGVSMRGSIEDTSAPSARKTQFYSMLGSRSIWHEGWKAVTTHPTIAGWGHFSADEWELYHTDVDRSELQQPGCGASREASGAGEPLVRGGRREQRVPTRRPIGRRDHEHPAAAADRATRPLRLLPGRGAGLRVAGGEHPRPLVRDRCARRHPGAGCRGRALRHRARASAATPST